MPRHTFHATPYLTKPFYAQCDNSTLINNFFVSTSRYSPGDVVMIQPRNHPDNVEEFIDFLQLNADKTFILQQNDPGRQEFIYIESYNLMIVLID